MIGYCFCGSFCTFAQSYEILKRLKDTYKDVIPIMSYNAYNTDTRFGTAEEFRERIFGICQN